MRTSYLLFFATLLSFQVLATDYHVGPGQTLAAIADAPWDALQAGDRVFIHWKSTPYYEKWVINAQGSPGNPIEIIGVSNGNGEKPVIDGNGAVTPTYLNFWNDARGIIKIGGSSVPSDDLPSYITIDNLEIRSAYPAYQFTDDSGQAATYSNNAASIYIEKGAHITIRNCEIHDSGNGIFIGAFDGATEDILIQQNYIHENGIVGSFYEHNTYTSAIDIIYEYNRFGSLRSGALGNNLKDRSAGLVVRYNWIEGGNRQLDLVEANGIPNLVNHPNYNSTYVYGNILIEPDGAGNSQILHYGGDNGNSNDYRKGTLYFYNNTIVSTRAGNTTLARLSTADETLDAFNNVIYATAGGTSLAITNDAGTTLLTNNWINTGWVPSHTTGYTGTINDQGNNIAGTDPLFVDFSSQNFRPATTSLLVDNGIQIPSNLQSNDVIQEYVEHVSSTARTLVGSMDIGAFEYAGNLDIWETNQNEWMLSPNPANDFVSITYPSQLEALKIEVIDFMGRSVLTSNENSIDVRHLAPGPYIVCIRSNQQRTYLTFQKE